MSIIYTLNLPLPPFNKAEILRYCGVKKTDEATAALLEDCLKEASGIKSGRICYREFDISAKGSKLDLGFAKTSSKLLANRLADCDKIILFAATVGVEPDRLVAKYTRLSPSRAVMLQAIGAERIEALCDLFENRLGREQPGIRSRVSPGYGDIPLSLQKEIFSALDCGRKIGLSLNESLLMSPAKSVTAIIGKGAEK